MNKNYPYKAYIFLIFIVSLFLKSHAQSPGDIAFIAFNADGDNDFAIVALTELAANSTIYITDKESDGAGGITSGEGTLTWFTGTTSIKAGTVIVFTDVDNGTNPNFGVSIGLLSETGGFKIPPSNKDGILAFVGTDDSSPTSFIAAIQIGNDPSNLGPFDGDEITLTNTGLVIGTSIIVVDSSASPDGAVYNASRASQTSYNEYYTLLIDDDSNWTNVVNGDGETLLPFSSEAFTIHTTIWTGTTSNVWNISSNWSNGIPTSSSLATVPNVTTSPIINSGTEAVVGNITIDTEENLTINSDNSMSVSGLLTINGSLEMNSGSSLLVLGTSTGNITYNRTLGTTNWYLVSSPVSGQGIVDFYTNESPALGNGVGDAQNIGIAPYDNSQVLVTDRWNYYTEGQVDGEGGDDTSDTFISGTGYAVQLQASGNISFTGTIPNDHITSVLSIGSGDAFNLIGNPYPSFIPANDLADGLDNNDDLLSVNTAYLSEETIWFWDQSANAGAGGYQEMNQASSGRYIAPGQGFFVSANTTATFTINENMQSHQSDLFQRNTTSTVPSIHLIMTNGTAIRDADIFYIDETTTGWDNGYDSSIFGGITNEFAIYTHAVADGNGRNLGIQSLPDNNYENMIIPVGVNAVSGTTITIDAATNNFPEAINIYLEDKLDNSFTLLDADANFSTVLENNLSGIGRFYLHTTSNTLSTNDLEISNNVSIYTSSRKNLHIAGIHKGTTKLQLYNILGKEILKTSFEGNSLNTIELPNLSNGLYIAKLSSAAGTISRKIIIQ